MVQIKKFMHMQSKEMEKYICQFQRWLMYMMLKYKIYLKQKL